MWQLYKYITHISLQTWNPILCEIAIFLIKYKYNCKISYLHLVLLDFTTFLICFGKKYISQTLKIQSAKQDDSLGVSRFANTFRSSHYLS